MAKLFEEKFFNRICKYLENYDKQHPGYIENMIEQPQDRKDFIAHYLKTKLDPKTLSPSMTKSIRKFIKKTELANLIIHFISIFNEEIIIKNYFLFLLELKEED